MGLGFQKLSLGPGEWGCFWQESRVTVEGQALPCSHKKKIFDVRADKQWSALNRAHRKRELISCCVLFREQVSAYVWTPSFSMLAFLLSCLFISPEVCERDRVDGVYSVYRCTSVKFLFLFPQEHVSIVLPSGCPSIATMQFLPQCGRWASFSTTCSRETFPLRKTRRLSRQMSPSRCPSHMVSSQELCACTYPAKSRKRTISFVQNGRFWHCRPEIIHVRQK